MSKRDAFTAFFLYMISGELVWTGVTIGAHWSLWLLGQPFLALVAAVIVAVTMGGKDK